MQIDQEKLDAIASGRDLIAGEHFVRVAGGRSSTSPRRPKGRK
jgi:hypothetical protein